MKIFGMILCTRLNFYGPEGDLSPYPDLTTRWLVPSQ